MQLDKIVHQLCPWWYNNEQEDSIIVSSRIRLARNLRNFLFISGCSPEEALEIEQVIYKKIHTEKVIDNFLYLFFNSTETDKWKETLFERHLISKDLLNATWPRGVAFTPEENISIMVNEEDHLRLQVVQKGIDLQLLWKEINALDNELDQIFGFAFHSKFGYLTACPTNVGTGMRVSTMLHLPALSITGQMSKVYRNLARHNIVIRGFYGEGSATNGDFYQISNQSTVGKKEKYLLRLLESVAPQVVNYEREARKRMMEGNRQNLQNLLDEALATIKNAKEISLEKATNCLSKVRLACDLGLTNYQINDVNRWLLFCNSSHLAHNFPTFQMSLSQARAKYLHQEMFG